jgi:hypothetical protein
MRIAARVFLQSALLLAVVAGPLVSDAVAFTSVVVSYNGVVNPQVPGVNFPDNVEAGDAISGSFGFTASQFSNPSTGVYTFSGSSPEGQTLSLNVSTPGYNPATWSDSYVAGGATFMITMSQPTSQETMMDLHVLTSGGSVAPLKPDAYVDIVLTSTTYTGSGLAGKNALPTTSNIGAFLNNSATLKWDPPGEGFTGYINTLDGVLVPEPSGLVLATVAMVMCTAGFSISRRKRAGALQGGRIATVPQP